MSAVWLCLLRHTDQSHRGQGQDPSLRVFPVLGNGCLSLWRGTGLYQSPGSDRSLGPHGVAGSLGIAGPPRTRGGSISASVAGPHLWDAPGTGHARDPAWQGAPGGGAADGQLCRGAAGKARVCAPYYAPTTTDRRSGGATPTAPRRGGCPDRASFDYWTLGRLCSPDRYGSRRGRLAPQT